MLFKKEIKEKVNLEGFTSEEKQEIVDKLEEAIIARVNLVILERLSEEDRNTFYEMSEKTYTPAIPQFLEQKIPDVSELITNTADKIMNDFNQLRTS